MSAPAVFSPKVMLAWIAAVAAAFALSVWLLAFGGGGSEQRSVGPSAFSRSAIGYAGFAELIGKAGIPVTKVRTGGVASGAAGKLLVLADPSALTEGQDGHYLFGDANRILLILPKWYGYRHKSHQGWISDAAPAPIGYVDLVIRKAGAAGKTARVARPESWSTNALGLAPGFASTVQLIDDTKLRPVVAAGSRVLVGEHVDRNRRIWIVSDPDMLSNHGLFSGRNAEFAVALVNALRPPRGEVVFNEWVTGTPMPSSANPLTLMLQFPYIVVTLQVLAASAFLLWAAMPRFGVPMPAPEMLAAGKQRLIRNAASLLGHSRNPEIIIANYVRLSIRGVARDLRSPPGLDWRRMTDWLARVGEARGVSVDFPGLVRRAEALTTAQPGSTRTLVEIVQDTYRWKREILNGP
jgi:hypothetical protein